MNKNIFGILTIFVIGLFVFVSCSDDDFPPPVISDLEIGYANSKVGYRGSDLHIDANIVAEGRIDRIIVEIHHEGDGHKSINTISQGDHDWEFEHTWTEFNGLLNSQFHKDIDIPTDAELGDYHFYLKVIDMQGKVTEVEAEIEVKNPESKNQSL